MLFLNIRKWFIIRRIRCAKDIKSVTPKTIETVFIPFFPDNFAEIKKRLESFRRIAMDYEFYPDTGDAMVQLAFCRLMYNKIYD